MEQQSREREASSMPRVCGGDGCGRGGVAVVGTWLRVGGCVCVCICVCMCVCARAVCVRARAHTHTSLQ